MVHFSRCANIVPPSGGPVDKTPPRIVKISPQDSSLNVRPKRIEIIFDKYMELGDWSTVMTISPLLDVQPQVVSNLKKVTISIPDTLLLDNTTYTIYLGNTLKDNREGTPYPEFNYTFSTGSYIDSLQLQGHVLNAATLKADTAFIAALYPTDGFTDSHIFNKKPLYVANVSSDGRFIFKHLPSRPFKMLVLHDRDNDKKYNPLVDGVAFDDKTYLPSISSDTLNTMYLFYQDLDSAESITRDETLKMIGNNSEKVSMRGNKSTSIIPKEGYLVQVDTTQIEVGTQHLNQPIEIAIRKHLVDKIDKDKLFLTFEKDGVEIQAITDIITNDSLITIKTDWQEASNYLLRLVKGWAIDTAGQELQPGRYNFMTKKKDDYSELQLKFDSSYIDSDHYVILMHEMDTIGIKHITDSIIVFNMITPNRSGFDIYVFKDLDKNTKWSSGNFILKKQPEPMWVHNNPLVLKAGWVHEESFKPKIISVAPQKSKASIKESDTDTIEVKETE